MELVYWVAVPATRQLHKSPACSWWESLNGAAVLPLQRLEVKHTADGSRMAGATVDSQIKHVHNEDKYWPRHRLKKRWDEKREGQGNAGVLIFFFFPQTKTLLGIQIRRNCGVEPNRKRADVTPRLTSKLTKQQSVVLLGAFAIPASALISLHAFEEGGTASFHAAAPRTRRRQRRNVFPTAGGRWETTERWS